VTKGVVAGKGDPSLAFWAMEGVAGREGPPLAFWVMERVAGREGPLLTFRAMEGVVAGRGYTVQGQGHGPLALGPTLARP